jgi:hypothetical protein
MRLEAFLKLLRDLFIGWVLGYVLCGVMVALFVWWLLS